MVGGEDVGHASIKALGHIGTGVVGRIAGTAIVAGAATLLGLTAPIGVGVAVGIILGTAATYGFDIAYDKWGRDVIDGVADIGKNVTKKIGSAVTGFFGNLKMAIS